MLSKKNWTTSWLAQNHPGRLQQPSNLFCLACRLSTSRQSFIYCTIIFSVGEFCSSLLEITLQWLYSLMAETSLLWFYPVCRSAREHKNPFLEYLWCTMKLLQSGICSFCGNNLPWMSNLFFFSFLIFLRFYLKRNTQTDHHMTNGFIWMGRARCAEFEMQGVLEGILSHHADFFQFQKFDILNGIVTLENDAKPPQTYS